MKLIVGLGNPGIKYINNRHNVGHMVIEELKKTIINNQSSIIKKTENFMNDSGSFIKHLISLYPNISISDLYVVHDDLDIKLGEYKIQFGKGPKEHNGLKSIDEALETRDYWHVRVGIDNRLQETGDRVQGEQYVLEDFTEGERIILNKTIKELCKKLVTL